jgi:cation transport ATPase
MTGDDMNDVLALEAAGTDLAIGSGMKVAQDATELIFVDLSFSAIIDAVGEAVPSAATLWRSSSG